VTLDERPRYRGGGYEVVVHEHGWKGAVRLDAGELDALMWRQLKRPVCLGRWTTSATQTIGLWRYHDAWYAAPAHASVSAVLEAIAAEALVGNDPPVAPADPGVDRFAAVRAAREPPETSEFQYYVGRLVWKRFLATLAEAAQLEHLEFTYQLRPRLFSIGLLVTVRGDPQAVARFAGRSKGIMFAYQSPTGS
jgi:hypothetical protein